MTDNEFSSIEEMPTAPVQVPNNLVPQSEVNAVIKRVKQEAFEQGKRVALTETQSQAQAAPAFDEDAFLEKVTARVYGRAYEDNKKAELERQKAENQRKADEYNAKLVKGLKEDVADDYEKVMTEFPHDDFPGLVRAGIADLPNMPHVLYHLAKYDPIQLTAFETMARTSPKLFKQTIKDYADSVDLNKKAVKEAAKEKEPLSRLKPKSVGVDAEKRAPVEPTFEDLREKYRSRF